MLSTASLQTSSALTVNQNLIENFGASYYDPDAQNCTADGTTATENDSPITTDGIPDQTVKQLEQAGVKQKADANMARYKAAEAATQVPWQIMAALHFREGGMRSDASISNGAPLGSGRNVDGVIIPADPNQDAIQAATIFKNNAKKVYGVDITANDANSDNFGQAFVAYNRGYMYKNWNMPWDKSPYAMNGFDATHLSMKWSNADSFVKPGGKRLNGLSGKVDGNPGALVVARYLGIELSTPTTTSDQSCSDSSTLLSDGGGSIVETGKGLAWPYAVPNGKLSKSDAKPEYQKAMPRYNGSTGTNEWSDCGVFVSTVMHMSGADKDFPKRGTAVMRDYVTGSPKYTTKDSPKLEDLKAGDILVFNNGGRTGHIMIYAGDIKPGFNGLAASLGQHVPDYETTGDITWMLHQPGVVLATLKQAGGTTNDQSP